MNINIKNSNYLVFVDESGDHILKATYKGFPTFILSLCIIRKDHYCDFILPRFTKLKLKYFPDVNTIFHEVDIRKAQNGFSFLTNESIRNIFMNDMNKFIEEADFQIIAAILDKTKLKEKQDNNIYHLAMSRCLNELNLFLKERGDSVNTTITFEARGKKEDRELEFAFLKEVHEKNYDGLFKISIQPKYSNLIGLQLADLIARPIGRNFLNPEQKNRAFELLEKKIRRSINMTEEDI